MGFYWIYQSNKMVDRFVIVAFTMTGCDKCNSFCREWEQLQEEVETQYPDQCKFRHFYSNCGYFTAIDCIKYGIPVHIIGYITWHPTVCVFPESNWNAVLQSKDIIDIDQPYNLLVGSTFNGKIINERYINGKLVGDLSEVDPHQAYTKDAILKWLLDNKQQYDDKCQKDQHMKLMLKEIIDTYHKFTLSPFWTKSESGLFLPEKPRYILGESAKRLFENYINYMNLRYISDRDIFELYRLLDLTHTFYFDYTSDQHTKLLSNHIKILLDQYVI